MTPTNGNNIPCPDSILVAATNQIPKTHLRKAKLFKRKKLDRRLLRLEDRLFDIGFFALAAPGVSSTANETAESRDRGSFFSSDMVAQNFPGMTQKNKTISTFLQGQSIGGCSYQVLL
jgi:hypothetical protein